MRIGVICEGPTDYHAIRSFFGAALESEGLDVDFIDLQPTLDATQAQAGWGNLERWLRNNPPASRIKRYFGGGLFDDDLDAKYCDAFLIQMDCDHLADQSFLAFNADKYGFDCLIELETKTRYEVAKNVIATWAKVDEFTAIDRDRHLLTPAQNSTESWCIGAFKRLSYNPDELSGQELINEFMDCLLTSEGRPLATYSNIDKDVGRRKKYCERHAQGFPRLISNPASFRMAFNALVKHCSL